MPFVAGTISSGIYLDGKPFARTANRVIGLMTRMADGAARLGRLMGVVGAAMSVAWKKSAGALVQASSAVEQFELRLAAALRSVGEGEELMKDLIKYAAEVPFELEHMVDTAASLAGVMQGGRKEILKWMPVISDLAGLTSLTFKETGMQIQRMYSAGAGAADLFREKGTTGMMGFKDGVKTSVAETRRVIMESFEKTDSQFRGLSDKLAKTWKGTMSMLRDSWFVFRLTVMRETHLFRDLKIVFKSISDALILNRAEIALWVRENAKLVRSLILGTGALAAFLAGTAALLLMLPGIAVALSGIVASINLITVGMAVMVAGAYALRAAWNQNFMGMADTLRAFGDYLQQALRNWTLDIEIATSYIGKQFKDLANFIIGIVVGIVGAAYTLAEEALDAIGVLVERVAQILDTVIKHFLPTMERLGRAIVYSLGDALKLIKMLIDPRTWLSGEQGLELLAAQFERFFSHFGKAFGPILKDLRRDLADLYTDAEKAGTRLAATLLGTPERIRYQVLEADHLKNLADFLKRAAPEWSKAMGKFAIGLAGAVSKQWEEDVRNIMDRIEAIMKERLPGVHKLMKDIGRRLAAPDPTMTPTAFWTRQKADVGAIWSAMAKNAEAAGARVQDAFGAMAVGIDKAFAKFHIKTTKAVEKEIEELRRLLAATRHAYERNQITEEIKSRLEDLGRYSKTFAETFKEKVGQALGSVQSAYSSFFVAVASGAESGSDAMRDFAQQFRDAWLRAIGDVMAEMLIAQQKMMLFGSAQPGGDWTKWGGLVGGAIGLFTGGSPSGTGGAGGGAGANPGMTIDQMGGSSMGQMGSDPMGVFGEAERGGGDITIINAISPEGIAAAMAQPPGQRVIINVIGEDIARGGPTVKTVQRYA